MIAAYQAALSAGRGVATLDGQMVEILHVEQARRLLARA
jgi:citrate lyase subunit beta/citryl-CoA lyase